MNYFAHSFPIHYISSRYLRNLYVFEIVKNEERMKVKESRPSLGSLLFFKDPFDTRFHHPLLVFFRIEQPFKAVSLTVDIGP